MRSPRWALLLAAAAAAAALAAGCAAPGAGALGGSSRGCADLFATAMASKSEVKGVWNCLAPRVQGQFQTVGLTGDAGIAKLAARDPVYTREHYLGRLDDGGYVYSLAGASHASAVLLVWLDGGGKIAEVQTGGRSAPAPAASPSP